MCTTGTKGLRGWSTRETPVAKNGLPAISAGVGGRMPSCASSSRSFAVDVAVAVAVDAWSTTAGYLSPHTAEKLQPPFSNTCPRSSLISPPPPPSRRQALRSNRPPSSSSSRAQIRSRKPRKNCSASARKAVIADAASCPTRCRGATPGSRSRGRLRLADRRRHFRGEVLRRLLGQALAERVPREAAHLDVLADHGDGRVDLVQHGPLAFRILEERLLEQAPAALLEDPVELAGEDLVDHHLGLVLLEELRAMDALLPIDEVLRDVLAAHPPRVAPGDLHRDVLHQRLELLVPRGEVGLAVHLDQHAHLAAHVDVRADGSFGGGTACLLLRGREPLLPEPVDRLLQVAARFLQRLLAVHHPRAGLLAQFLHHRRRDLSHLAYGSGFSSAGAAASPSPPPSCGLRTTSTSGPPSRETTGRLRGPPRPAPPRPPPRLPRRSLAESRSSPASPSAVCASWPPPRASSRAFPSLAA